MRPAHHPGPNLATLARSASAPPDTGGTQVYEHILFDLPPTPPASQLKRCLSLSRSLQSYNPYDGPNEHPEAELPLVAGKYLYVYGDMDDDGFYEGKRINVKNNVNLIYFYIGERRRESEKDKV